MATIQELADSIKNTGFITRNAGRMFQHNVNTTDMVVVLGGAINASNENVRIVYRNADQNGPPAISVTFVSTVAEFKSTYTRMQLVQTYQTDADTAP